LEAARSLLDAVEHGQQIGGEKGALEADRRLGTITSSGTLQLAQRYLEEGNLERATELYREVAEAAPENLGAAYGLGYALLQVGRYEEAANSFRWILGVSPESADARNALAYVFAQTGDSLATAEVLAEEALELDPDRAAYWNDTLGWVRYRAGDFEEALEALERAKEGLPLDDRSMLAENDYHLGSTLAALGRVEEARDHLIASARRVENEVWSLELRSRLRELGIEEDSI
jgi:tetratricopeptide (TPR) repeat protein